MTPSDVRSAPVRVAEPSKAGEVVLARHPRVRETAERVLAGATAQLRENVAGALAGDDPEYVHQMRVAIRRLRTALKFFRANLPSEARAHAASELRWIFGLMGPLREHDLVLFQLGESGRRIAGRSKLRREVERQRDRHQEALARALDSARFHSLVASLVDLQVDLSKPQATRSAKLKPFVARELNARLRKVKRYEGAVESRDVGALHVLRKELKKLRYACDGVQSAYGRRATARYSKRLRALQELLGQLQDVAASKRVLAQHLRCIGDRRQRASLRVQLMVPLDARATRVDGELADAWRALIETKPFWNG